MYGHVLVVDDQPLNIERLQQATAGDLNGFIFVTSIPAALYVLYEYDINHEVELIACNVGVGDGDICQFIRTVKNDSHWSSLPLLAIVSPQNWSWNRCDWWLKLLVLMN
jgi:CheY-like chemotaxis protein